MTITEIYKKYKINKGLQEHMIRVAAVAKMICDASKVDLETENIVEGCLVHDMGNLIKSKMDTFPEFFDPEGVDYWIKVKEEMIEKYDNDVHGATVSMVEDMNLEDKSVFYFRAIGGDDTQRVHAGGTLGEKIATYSDMRIGLHGAVSLKERMDDIRRRYIERNMEGFSSDDIDVREQRLADMEKDIFANSNIQPSDITDKSTEEIQDELWEWEVTCISK